MTTATTRDADVAVVGAGFAGLAAGLRARELGARVVIFERTDVAPSYSNSRMAGGMYHVSLQRPTQDPAVIEAKILKETAGRASEEVIHALAHENRRAWDWTKTHGARYVHVRSRGMIMAPLRPNRRGNDWIGRGPDRTVRCLYEAYLRAGGEILHSARARELSRSGGRVIGLMAETPAGRVEVRAPAVVLADGGFQSDVDLLRSLAGVTRPENLFQRGAATGAGDGLRMALDAGARVVEPHALYGHLIHADALANPQLTPYPMLDTLASGSLLVGPHGERFCDEGRGGIHMVDRLVRAEKAGQNWLVFDRDTWHTIGRVRQIVPPNPNLVQAGARIERGTDAVELARAIGVPPAALEATLREYVDAVAHGAGKSLRVLRSGSPRVLAAPIYAVPVIVGLTFTMGGPLIDGGARVLADGGAPVTGLYAAGGSAGGISGGPNPAYEGGLAVALTFGMIAGESAVRDVGRS